MQWREGFFCKFEFALFMRGIFIRITKGKDINPKTGKHYMILRRMLLPTDVIYSYT